MKVRTVLRDGAGIELVKARMAGVTYKRLNAGSRDSLVHRSRMVTMPRVTAGIELLEIEALGRLKR